MVDPLSHVSDGEWPNCACGCGQPVTALKYTDSRRGYVKGAPARYIKGHSGGKVSNFDTVTDPATGCITYVTPHRLPYRTLRPEMYSETVQAHRYTWTQAHGPIPDGYVVHHRCENQRCINVEHLELMGWGEHTIHHKKGKTMAEIRGAA